MITLISIFVANDDNKHQSQNFPHNAPHTLTQQSSIHPLSVVSCVYPTFEACFPAPPLCTNVDDERDPRPWLHPGAFWKGNLTPHGWIFRFCNSAGVQRLGLTGRTSRVCQLWFSRGPSSSGPAETDMRAPLNVASGAQPSPPPAAPHPSTLFIGWLWHTHFLKGWCIPKYGGGVEMQTLWEKVGKKARASPLRVRTPKAIHFNDWIITTLYWKGIKLNYDRHWIMLH